MEFTFTEIRNSHSEIKEMLEDFSGDEVKDLKTKLAEDLSLWGDDNHDFLVKFVDKYQLDWDDFDYSEYFLSEGELFNSQEVLKQLIYLPFTLLFWLLSLLFPKVDNPFHSMGDSSNFDQKDLTFGDLIAWKLKGKFCLRKDLLIELKS